MFKNLFNRTERVRELSIKARALEIAKEKGIVSYGEAKDQAKYELGQIESQLKHFLFIGEAHITNDGKNLDRFCLEHDDKCRNDAKNVAIGTVNQFNIVLLDKLEGGRLKTQWKVGCNECMTAQYSFYLDFPMTICENCLSMKAKKALKDA